MPDVLSEPRPARPAASAGHIVVHAVRSGPAFASNGRGTPPAAGPPAAKIREPPPAPTAPDRVRVDVLSNGGLSNGGLSNGGVRGGDETATTSTSTASRAEPPKTADSAAVALMRVSSTRSQSLTLPPPRTVDGTRARDSGFSESAPLQQVASLRSAALGLGLAAAAAAAAAADAMDGEDEQQQRGRASRRAMSDEFALSMLQEELGYPRRRLSRAPAADKRPRVESLAEDISESSAQPVAVDSHSSSSSKSSWRGSGDESPSRRRSLPEPEAEKGRGGRDSLSKQFISGLYDEGEDPDASSSDERGGVDGDEVEIEVDQEVETDGNQSSATDGDDNFMDVRVASVTGYSRDTDGVVYYEVIVRSTTYGPLSAFKVRRRYSEFRDLHRALARIMPVSAQRLHAVSSMGYHHATDDGDGDAVDNQYVGLRFSLTGAPNAEEEVTLPPLPDKGGLWSYLHFDSVPLLERRARYFHAMLMAAQRHAGARQSRLLNEFVGTPPDVVALHSSLADSYVSLRRFAAPRLDMSVEVHERKQKAQSIRRRRSSLSNRHSLPSQPDLM